MATLFYNGRFFQSGPGGKDHSFAECLLADATGTIVHVGGLADEPIADAEKSGHLTRNDMQGRVVLPGFIDGHMHLLMFGQSLQKCELDDCENLDDIRAAIKAFAAARPDVPRIMCKGWMQSMTDGHALASMIDDIDTRPIFIDSKDLHSTWCNTPALKELGVLEPMPNPEGGNIERDPTTGLATGHLTEAAAVVIVWPHIAKVAPMEAKLGAIRSAVSAYNAAGYTGLVEMATDENILEALEEALRQQEADGDKTDGEVMPMRFALHWLIYPSKTEAENIAQVDRAIELAKRLNNDSAADKAKPLQCRIAGIKVICDGIIDGCTAALTEPYTSNGASPDAMWSLAELAPVVRKADAAGLQCALHAIGDLAIRTAIDALEQLTQQQQQQQQQPTTPLDRRHRIEHLELASPRDAARLGALGITASIQPVHADPSILRAWPSLLGPERVARAFAYREFAEGGAVLALGSDSPTAPHAPLKNMYTATTRRSARQPGSRDTVNGHFALGLAAATEAATRGSAYSCFAGGWAGTLDKGKRADLAVVDMEWDAERLLQARVVQTWFEGKKVFDAEG